jgi:probable addiction module antidote protein
VPDLPEFDAAEFIGIDDDSVAAYLIEIIDAGDAALLASALGNLARARGMASIADAAGNSREALYKALPSAASVTPSALSSSSNGCLLKTPMPWPLMMPSRATTVSASAGAGKVRFTRARTNTAGHERALQVTCLIDSSRLIAVVRLRSPGWPLSS